MNLGFLLAYVILDGKYVGNSATINLTLYFYFFLKEALSKGIRENGNKFVK